SEYTEVYEAECPAGTSVQWGFAAYDATTPPDSAIVFEARTAATEGELGAATWASVATAESSPTDTQKCQLSGPAPCPLDLWTILGGPPLVHLDVLELKATLVPGGPNDSITPSLNSWQVTYSCPDSQ
ncbi:MAG: hypothetical protein JRI68_31900, partial [Deltaproteobacteria bacterium]|nr:hypothetical protein [Deltaproteobacteria bacterium]